MTVNRWSGVTIDCADPIRMSPFWAALLDSPASSDVKVDDIDTGRQQIEELGGSFSGFRHDYGEGVVLNMLDPEGHEFCLVQYFNNPTPRR